MCGFIVTNSDFKENSSLEEVVRRRGPDSSSSVRVKDILMKHYLLSMTGDPTPQPVEASGVYCLFNGEVYNFKSFTDKNTDVHAILEAYTERGYDYAASLDGEYAIVIVDTVKNTLVVTTDVFGTKPLFLSFEDGKFGIASYPNVVRDLGFRSVKRAKPNTTAVYSLENLQLVYEKSNHTFDLTQHIKSYDGWHDAFRQSIVKRFTNIRHDIILPLSSGHDSGLIACMFNELSIPYTTYTFPENEDVDVVRERFKINSSKTCKQIFYSPPLSDDRRARIQNSLRLDYKSIPYGPDNETQTHDGVIDPGANGLYGLLEDAKSQNQNIRILASGQGADELMTTNQAYKFGTPNPAVWPDDLSTVFPWQNFFYGAQSSYLLKEETIAGNFGIESRYAFLDKNVVQNFLWLTSDAKNRMYKPPVTDYLKKSNYPFALVKRGFNA